MRVFVFSPPSNDLAGARVVNRASPAPRNGLAAAAPAVVGDRGAG